MVKNLPDNVGDLGLIPGSGRSLGEGNGTPLQCLGNPMDRGAWWATVHGLAESNMSECLSTIRCIKYSFYYLRSHLIKLTDLFLMPLRKFKQVSLEF